MHNNFIIYFSSDLVCNCAADHHLKGIVGIRQMEKLPLYHVLLEGIQMKTLSNSLKKNPQHLIIRLYQSCFMTVLLHMVDESVFFIIVVQINIVEEGLLFHRIVHRKSRHQQVGAKAIYLTFNGGLKAFHNQKRYNGST